VFVISGAVVGYGCLHLLACRMCGAEFVVYLVVLGGVYTMSVDFGSAGGFAACGCLALTYTSATSATLRLCCCFLSKPAVLLVQVVVSRCTHTS
jgi:hypothetical protein